ncbi:MAG: hydroxymethylglutaryl-CoA lyase [Pseudomonadota bacterium]
MVHEIIDFSQLCTDHLPTQVKVVEVGVRDGLQNELNLVDTTTKLELIHRLIHAGVRSIEVGAFVSPKWVPQMANTSEVLNRLIRKEGIAYSVLVPNMKGLEQALAQGCKEIAVFAAASESFSQKNINCSIAESLNRFQPVIEEAKKHGVNVRAYVSCVVHCPFEGVVSPQTVVSVASILHQMGCYEISLGDTTGRGTPATITRMIEACSKEVQVGALAGHFHDTYGMAIANIVASLQCGISIFDSSVAGLGGCPYSPGATGNVATEDVVYFLEGLGIETGLDLGRLIHAGEFICSKLHPNSLARVEKPFLVNQI